MNETKVILNLKEMAQKPVKYFRAKRLVSLIFCAGLVAIILDFTSCMVSNCQIPS